MEDVMSNNAAPALDHAQLRMYRGGFWLLLINDSMIFVSLISTRYLLAGTTIPSSLGMVMPGIVTVLMLISAWFANRALHAIQDGDQGTMVRNLWITIVLGLAALVVNVYAWLGSGLDWSTHYGGIFWLTSLYHDIHILAGLLALFALAVSGAKGRYSTANHWVVEAGQLFWVYTVVVWVAVYLVLYWI